MELMPLSDRPAVLDVAGGGRTYICVHDEYYRRTKREWKQKLFNTHPDHFSASDATRRRRRHDVTIEKKAFRVPAHQGRYGWVDAYIMPAHTEVRKAGTAIYGGRGRKGGGMAARFLAVRHAYERWLAKEQAWYAQYGLEPPHGPRVAP